MGNKNSQLSFRVEDLDSMKNTSNSFIPEGSALQALLDNLGPDTIEDAIRGIAVGCLSDASFLLT